MSAASLPSLATCSYGAFRREMGSCVRITLSAPRVRLPDPRYGDFTHWPYIAELAPRRSYFRAPADEFDREYLAQLDRLADDIESKLSVMPSPSGTIVLCCYERAVTGPEVCHRRLFAGWAQQRWGIDIPELDAAPGGCT